MTTRTRQQKIERISKRLGISHNDVEILANSLTANKDLKEFEAVCDIIDKHKLSSGELERIIAKSKEEGYRDLPKKLRNHVIKKADDPEPTEVLTKEKFDSLRREIRNQVTIGKRFDYLSKRLTKDNVKDMADL